MGLVGDIEEVKRFWGEVSWGGRILIVLSAFFAISPIASLSDAVFQWKGFILTGVELYRYWVSLGIDLLKSLGVTFNYKYIDAYIVISIFYFSMVRRRIFSSSFLSQILALAITFVFVVSLIISMDVVSSRYSDRDNSFYLMLGYIFLLLTYPFGKSFEKNELFAYYLPVTITFTSILILAAINAGLERVQKTYL